MHSINTEWEEFKQGITTPMPEPVLKIIKSAFYCGAAHQFALSKRIADELEGAEGIKALETMHRELNGYFTNAIAHISPIKH
jgi:hypothetical protein